MAEAFKTFPQTSMLFTLDLIPELQVHVAWHLHTFTTTYKAGGGGGCLYTPLKSSITAKKPKLDLRKIKRILRELILKTGIGYF